ncbi:MAG: glycosyltransferase family 2 protein [Paludibacteraceae bacterium]|nr:glycosyltransferase family 2 protein [Paludibacteraceae bacterium]MBR4713797.1 glycosyltransferase family 2 protein [Paludibacteraceae bacterium]
MEVEEKMIYAPVVIPTLCRSTHFKRTVESLKRNGWAKYTDVYIGLDYPPAEKYEQGWKEICEYLETSDFSVFNKFVVLKREKNMGSYENSADLIRNIKAMNYDRWIYSDDDIEYAPNFLEYMNKCLTKYYDDPRVFAVTSYSYPIDWTLSEGSTCFLQDFNACTWGIGFMRKKEEAFYQYATSGNLLKAASEIIKSGSYKKMLDACFYDYFYAALSSDPNKPNLMKYETDISMRAYIPHKNMYCVTPAISKSRNYGFDGSGVFCQKTSGENKNNATTASNYNYGEQAIDEAESFELILDDNPSHLEINRQKLNAFDYRSPEVMKLAHQNFKLIKWFGLPLAKIIHLGCFAVKKMKSTITGK